MAENQRLQITNQLQQLNTDYQTLLNRFKLLLHSKADLEPAEVSSRYDFPVTEALLSVETNPGLQLEAQQIDLLQQQYQLEKSKLLPSLNLGYNNTSIIGWQTNDFGADQYYGSGNRFSSISIGLGIPIFFGAQKSRIKAARIRVTQQQKELEAGRLELMNDLKTAANNQKQYQAVLSNYENFLLPNAKKIILTSTQKLQAGEIDYLNWVVLMNQAIQIRSQYFDTIKQYNESAFEIERIGNIK